jgi:membrane-associated phospholipid phosphatase
MNLFPSTLAWRLTFLLVLVEAVLFPLTGLTLDPFVLLAMAVIAGPFLVVAIFYHYRRPDPVMNAITTSFAFLAIFSPIGAGLSYLSVVSNFPLRDAWAAAADEALGFSWLGHLETVGAYKWMLDTLSWCYDSAFRQICLAILLLGFFDRERLRLFLHCYATTGTACILIAWTIPVAGAYFFHQPEPHLLSNFSDPLTGRWQEEVFFSLRNGTLTWIKLHQSEGLIQFPSFHSAMAVVLVYAYWGFRWLRLPALGLNSLMAAATPIIGGHFLIDTLIGLLIGVLAIWFFKRRPLEQKAAALPSSAPLPN